MRGRILVSLTCAIALAIPSLAFGSQDSLVSVGSNPAPFPQNKQNEPAVAVDPWNPQYVIAGSNDEIDEPNCVGNSCPFVQGIGNTGVYWSRDGGSTWTQPKYSGYSARHTDGSVGSPVSGGFIGTLPNYDTAGLVSDGDPAVAWGPAPGRDGTFKSSTGERAYFANLTSNFSGKRSDEAFKGYEAIAVSHTLDLVTAMSDGGDAGWSKPSIVSDTRQSSSTFSDKEAVWADNAKSSPNYGNVYVCWTDFRSATLTGNGNAPIMISRSTDGGDSWSRGVQLTPAHNNAAAGGRQGCDMRTDSKGVLYVFFTDSADKMEAIKLIKSTDGGKTFGKSSVVTHETNPGGPSVVRPGENDNIDGVAGSRTDDFPHVSIANGAPDGDVTGKPAANSIALTWNDGGDGLGDEHVYLKMWTPTGGWTDKQALEAESDRPAMPSAALSPDGTQLYLVYNAFKNPFRESVGRVDELARGFEAVVRRWNVDGTGLSGEAELYRSGPDGGLGDARASSANALIDEFLGDYNMVSATNQGAVAVYITAQDAVQCPDVNAYRDSLVNEVEDPDAEPAGDAPSPCNGSKFGNTDIRGYFATPDPSIKSR